MELYEKALRTGFSDQPNCTGNGMASASSHSCVAHKLSRYTRWHIRAKGIARYYLVNVVRQNPYYGKNNDRDVARGIIERSVRAIV